MHTRVEIGKKLISFSRFFFFFFSGSFPFFFSRYYSILHIQEPMAQYSIIFIDKDEVEEPHHGALIVSLNVTRYTIKRILVDGGSSANILMWSTFKEMKLGVDSMIKRVVSLKGFNRGVSNTMGEVKLSTWASDVHTLTK